jgi:DNA modification methylase
MSDRLTILAGDVLAKLRELPDGSVQCCVTSPPYWGLRDYQAEGQLGLEKTPEEYVANMVAVFREVKRVLRDDGTLWLNLGDSYASAFSCDRRNVVGNGSPDENCQRANRLSGILKEKDLCGIPWRVAFALQADGWYLRSDIIWNKPNPMPESVRDRCCKSHEYVFLLSKSQRYFFDLEAIKENAVQDLQQVSEKSPNQLFLFEQPAEGWSEREVSRLHADNSESVGSQIQLDKQSKGVTPEVLSFPEGSDDKESVSGNLRSNRGTERTLPDSQSAEKQVAPSESTNSTLLAKQKGKANESFEGCSVAQDSQRPVRQEEDRTTTEISDQEIGMFPDKERMGSHQNEPSESMRLLRETDAVGNGSRQSVVQRGQSHERERGSGVSEMQRPKRTPRSVWTINTEAFPGAHFATFPKELARRCILAGTSAKGCCARCGSPWERIVERERRPREDNFGNRDGAFDRGQAGSAYQEIVATQTVGWQPTCECDSETVPCSVLDPFAGSGTTGAGAIELGRNAILIELNPKYVELIRNRCNVTPGLALA